MLHFGCFEFQRLGAGSEDSNISIVNLSERSSPSERPTVLSEDNSVNEQSLESIETNQPKEMEKGSLEKRKLRFSSHEAAEERKEKSSKQEKRERKDGKKNEWDMFAEADTLEEYNVWVQKFIEEFELAFVYEGRSNECHLCAPHPCPLEGTRRRYI
jgi:hypothetical protein